MSSRQLRKLQQQRELEQAKLREKEQVERTPESEEEDGEEQVPSINKPSLFANFAALQADEDQDDDSEAGDQQFENDGQRTVSNEQLGLPNTGRKSKKAKKKRKRKTKQTEESKPTSRFPVPRSDINQDEIDAAVQELSLKNARNSTNSTTPTVTFHPEYERICVLFGINTQHLKVANEMRNLFGRTAVENHDDAGGQVPRGARRRQRAAQRQVDLETALKGHHAPGKGLPELTLRRNIFIQGKDDWPKGTTGGLTMEIVDDLRTVDGTVEFRFVHNQAYNLVQQQFHMFVEMGDPQNLIGLLQRNPYNISLLLQVSKIAKDQTDHALSSDLVERGLFTFGRAAQSFFATKLSQGKARLDFARPENREFWLAGYQYIKSLMMKGTYRTALEWAKLLWALDPEEDPYCMLLMIHHLALRAYESKWLLDISENSMLTQRTFTNHMSPSFALAAMQLKDGTRSRSLLQKSIQLLPWLFCRLFQELNLDNPPPSIWGAQPRTNAENLFSEIYVRQTKDLWNTPEATALLMEVAHAAGKLNNDNPPRLDNSEITLDVARFVYLDNTPDLMALVPSNLLHRTANSDSDPLPPDQNIFSWESQRLFFTRGGDSRGNDRAFGDNFDPIAALRALIPGFRNDGNGGEGQGITDNELREFLESEVNRHGATAAAAASSEEEEDEEDGEEEEGEAVSPRPSGMRRLYELIFGTRSPGQERDLPDDPESESDSGGQDSDRH